MAHEVRLLRTSIGSPAGHQLLRVRGLSKSYQDGIDVVHACREIEFDLAPGEMVLIRGPSGSGKSTLLMACAGLIPVDAGQIEVAGSEMRSATETERARTRLERIGVVFQDHLLVEEYTAGANVQLPLEARGWSMQGAHEEAISWLERVGLGEMAHRHPWELSGGQRQRVGLARALVGGRHLIVADEPTGSLDSATSRDIFDLLHELSRRDVGVLIASHDPQVEDLADRVFDMHDGWLVGAP